MSVEISTGSTDNLEITVHQAGLIASFGPRMIQRCSVCGLKIYDSEERPKEDLPPGLYADYRPFREGSFFASYKGKFYIYSPMHGLGISADGQTPNGSCMALVEAGQ